MSDDLYGDLMDAKVAAAAPTNTNASTSMILDPTTNNTTMPSSSELFAVEQLDHLQKRIEELEVENHQLKRNMGTLYRTAKNELKRKDDHIARLMQEVDEAGKR
jgi:FtsZ-binding cell division protein ZapB